MSLTEVSLASLEAAGGKVLNLARAGRDVATSTADIRVPRSAVWDELDSVDIVASFEDWSEQLLRCGLSSFPLMVRSSASTEDAADSRMSGLLNSVEVRDMDELRGALVRLRREAEDLNALPVSALVQERISYDFGVVAGICGDRRGPVAGRIEFGESVVPVETQPSSWIAFECVRGDPVAWRAVEDSGVLSYPADLTSVAVKILAYVTSLQWPEKYNDQWYCEVEACVVGGAVVLFQLRFDLSGSIDLRRPPPTPLPFGAGRNFPVPVSRLTAGMLSPVLSEQFGAAVALDETRRCLMCCANNVPPAVYVDSCIRHARDGGLLSFESILEDSSALNRRWREVRDFRRAGGLDGDLGNWFLEIREFFRLQLRWYFENSTFRRAVGTEYLLESDDASGRVAELISQKSRASRAAILYSKGSLDRVLSTDDSYRDVYLFGDDSIGSMRLLERLGGDRQIFDSLISAYFSRDDVFTADSIVAQMAIVDEVGLSPSGQALYASVWYQEQDNQFKDAIYFLLRECLLKVADVSGISVEELAQLDPSEILDLLEFKISSDEGRLRAGLRASAPRRGDDVVAAGRQTEVVEIASGAGSLGPEDCFEGNVVIVENLAAVSADAADVRMSTLYVVAAASPMECLEVPCTGGLWLYQLGELCHAAHILRSRSEFSILIFGEAAQVATSRGFRRILRTSRGFRFEQK